MRLTPGAFLSTWKEFPHMVHACWLHFQHFQVSAALILVFLGPMFSRDAKVEVAHRSPCYVLVLWRAVLGLPQKGVLSTSLTTKV